jgi:membrane-associated protease RseP (regulator of RpoE activity)
MKREVEVKNENEILDRDELTVSRLVAELAPVEAPANFERRVMSQIAEGRPRQRSMFAFPALVYALPAVVVLLLGAFVIFKLRQPAVVPSEIADSQPASAVEQAPIQSHPTLAPQSPTVAQNDANQSAPQFSSAQQTQPRQSALTNSNKGGGSITFGVNQTRQPMPEGLDPRSHRTNVNPKEIISSTPIGIREILMMIGMTAEFNNEWRVTGVTANSPAEKSGIKVGDVVVTINDQQLTAKTTYQGAGTFSTVTVRRDGKVIPIKLK